MSSVFRKMAIAAAIALPLGIGSVASAAEAPTTTAPAADPNDEKVCKTIRPTGSRLGKRVCHTRGEWAQSERNAQSALDDSKDSGQAWQPRLPQ